MEKKPEATWCSHIKAFGFFKRGATRLKLECQEPMVASWQTLSWTHFDCWSCHEKLNKILKIVGSDSLRIHEPTIERREE